MNRPIRVLYVAGDPTVGEQLAASLEAADPLLEVQTTTDAADALIRLDSEDLDCLVSVNEVTEGAGVDLLRRVRARFPDLPTILYTEDCTAELVREVISAEATEYLPMGMDEPEHSMLADRIVDTVSVHRAAERARELERINTVVRELNRALVRAETIEEIDTRVCEIISESGPYRFAWIGEHDPETRTVTPRAAAGVEEDYLEEITITTDCGPTAQGPTGRAIRSHEIQVMQDIQTDPAYEPWREAALERGYESSAAVPLVHGDDLNGVLNVYADRPRAFDEDERTLLRQVGADIAYAINDVRLRDEFRRRESHLEQAQAVASLGSWYLDIQTGELEWSDEVYRIFGVPTDESPTYEAFLEHVHPEDRDLVDDRWSAALEGEPYDLEHRIVVDGGTRWVREKAEVETDDEGTLIGGIGVVQDVTERKDREEALRAREELYEAVVENIHDGLAIISDGEIQYVNARLLELTGYTRADLVGEPPTGFVAEGDRESTMEQYRQRVSGEDPAETYEIDFLTSDGETIPAEVSVGVFEYEGAPATITAIRDIRERKAREAELRDQKAFMDRMLDAIDDVFYVIGEAGQILRYNRSVLEVWGYTDDEVRAMTLSEFVDERQVARLERAYREAMESGSARAEVDAVTNVGEYIPYEFVANAVEDPDGETVLVGIGRDVSELVERTRQLRVLDRILRHNFHNAISVIEGYAETIQQEAEDEVAADAGVIVDESERLLSTVDKEREIVELLSEQPMIDEIDLSATCRRVAGLASDAYPDAEIEVDVGDGAVASGILEIERAIEELVENAVIHADRPTPSISITAQRHDGAIRLAVADDGPGIPSEELGVLTGERDVEPLYHGSGLGLWLVHWIVKRSGGTLCFKANEPRGSVVTIELPTPEST